jgi:hypothetical protein
MDIQRDKWMVLVVEFINTQIDNLSGKVQRCYAKVIPTYWYKYRLFFVCQ